jgi:dipeptidyl aminopeptidase/acylaminoacyl peptidase
VLFVRTTTDLATGRRNSDIWTVPADGSTPPRPFIEGPKGDDSPRFLGNGRVVFMSTRDGAPQLYVADGEGGTCEPSRSSAPACSRRSSVSPDGRMVAFVSDAFPRCADDACNARVRDSIEKDAVKVHTLGRLPYRHWSEWWGDGAASRVRHRRRERRHARSHARRLRLAAALLRGRRHRVLTGFARARVRVQARRKGFRDVDDESRRVERSRLGGTRQEADVESGGGHDAGVLPDGRWIVVRAQRRPGFEADRWYLDAYDRASGAKRTLFTTPDLSVDDFKFSPDGKTIWFIAVRNGTENLYTIPATGGTPTLAVQGGAVSAFSRPTDSPSSRSHRSSPPADLYRVAKDGTTRQLTNEKCRMAVRRGACRSPRA